MLFIGELERVRNTLLRVNNNGTINSGSKPRNMSVPEKCALLLYQSELIREVLSSLYGALCNVRRAIGPTRQPLPDAMPDEILESKVSLICHNMWKWEKKGKRIEIFFSITYQWIVILYGDSLVTLTITLSSSWA